MSDSIKQSESSQTILRRYLAIPVGERLKVVEANLNIMVQASLKDDPGEVGVKLNTIAVMLDIVREIRQIKQHLGLASAEDSKAPAAGQVESSGLLVPEQLPLSEANL